MEGKNVEQKSEVSSVPFSRVAGPLKRADCGTRASKLTISMLCLRPRAATHQAFQPEAFWSIKMEYAEDDPSSPGGVARADFAWQRVRSRKKAYRSM